MVAELVLLNMICDATVNFILTMRDNASTKFSGRDEVKILLNIF